MPMSTGPKPAPEIMDVAEFFAASRMRLHEAAEMAGIPFRDFREMIDQGQGPTVRIFRAASWVALSDMNSWISSRQHLLAPFGLDPAWGKSPRERQA